MPRSRCISFRAGTHRGRGGNIQAPPGFPGGYEGTNGRASELRNVRTRGRDGFDVLDIQFHADSLLNGVHTDHKPSFSGILADQYAGAAVQRSADDPYPVAFSEEGMRVKRQPGVQQGLEVFNLKGRDRKRAFGVPDEGEGPGGLQNIHAGVIVENGMDKNVAGKQRQMDLLPPVLSLAPGFHQGQKTGNGFHFEPFCDFLLVFDLNVEREPGFLRTCEPGEKHRAAHDRQRGNSVDIPGTV